MWSNNFLKNYHDVMNKDLALTFLHFYLRKILLIIKININ